MTSLFEDCTPPLSGATELPPFGPPVGPPAGESSTVDTAVYTFSETYTNDVSRTISIVLQIGMHPNGSFDPGPDGLPNEAIFLNAVAKGSIRVIPPRPNTSELPALELTTETFGECLLMGAKWWRNWQRAGRIPGVVRYENVDLTVMEDLLGRAANAPERSFRGLSFPKDVVEPTAYVTEVLAGQKPMLVAGGALCGAAGIDPTYGEPHRMLRLHVYYRQRQGAGANDPLDPMNPRELLYLMFGSTSIVATGHPLLKAMDTFAKNDSSQKALYPPSRRMLLRPPLRTAARVFWEADREIEAKQTDWDPGVVLTKQSCLNRNWKTDKHFEFLSRKVADAYPSTNKCNVFVSELGLRGGFRMGLHNAGSWHFITANSYCTWAHLAPAGQGSLFGQQETDIGPPRREWGRALNRDLLALPDEATRMQALNDIIQQEQRCVIVAGMRPRKFNAYTIVQGVKGIADCTQAPIQNGIGHVVLIENTHTVTRGSPPNQETFGLRFEQDGQLSRIGTSSYQATGSSDPVTGKSGARHMEWGPTTGAGFSTSPGGEKGFRWLEIIELLPGGDPDTLQGLRDLNVVVGLRNPAAADMRAKNVKKTHQTNGQPIPPAQQNRCCRDNYPGAATEVSCT